MILYRYSKEKLCLGHSLAFFYRRAHLVRFVSFPKPSHPFTEFPVHFLKKIMQQKKKIMQQKKTSASQKLFIPFDTQDLRVKCFSSYKVQYIFDNSYYLSTFQYTYMVRKISDMQGLITLETERIINPQLLKFPMTHANPVYKIFVEDFFLKTSQVNRIKFKLILFCNRIQADFINITHLCISCRDVCFFYTITFLNIS